ncbi:phosphoribosylanthranilate isomerase [Lentimicrobium sp. S6]|uniref:phosphoribosylanthranilate isomerase n=1 Tax=Lentimicrobium sp. S6 TaxID=2735872 RepID=UPI001554234D|nr:phosphoribosylanthranilate isomerase [Lentimicrobium sp. S6]NPD46703.1 phosphoribosylanthranilate isomerase [Lentimicrobium sp. S6]
MLMKVCGMKYSDNISALASLKPDMMGFIFYPKSKRFVDKKVLEMSFREFDENISKVAVFVNKSAEFIASDLVGLHFDYIQLHGKEPIEEVIKLKNYGYKIIKAFPMSNAFEWDRTEAYEAYCDYFVFDTSSPNHGGSGQQFDWNILKNYQGKTPFLLSGGISIQDIEQIKKFQHPQLAGIDINSKFEIEPGLKDIDLVQKMIKEFRR